MTMATVLKSQGYATGQFGKNHQGDRDEHLPTMHGFDEFLGNLYHLNAEEEPENEDYPKIRSSEAFGPRGVLKATADGKITQDTGPLTKKRMESSTRKLSPPPRTSSRARSRLASPLLLVERHPDALPHAREGGAPGPLRPGRIQRRHGRTRQARGGVAEAARRTRHRQRYHRAVFNRQRPALQHMAHAGTMPFRSEKNSNWEGAYRVPAFVRWPGHFPAGETLNGIVSHEDWLPTFAAIAGAPDIKEKLLKGVELNGRSYKNYIDGYNQLDYLSGKVKEAPRNEFMYVNDDGQIVAMRYQRLEGRVPRKPWRGLWRLA